jgi:hypothetical protein
MASEREPAPSSSRLKQVATLGVIVGTAVWTGFFFGFLVVSAVFPDAVPESWLLSMIREHPGPTLAIAMSAISSFCVLGVLDVFARDPIEIKFLGFELRGAAGPVVLWALCFAVFVGALETLWDNGGMEQPNGAAQAAASGQRAG